MPVAGLGGDTGHHFRTDTQAGYQCEVPWKSLPGNDFKLSDCLVSQTGGEVIRVIGGKLMFEENMENTVCKGSPKNSASNREKTA
jgi:hypothetical protein